MTPYISTDLLVLWGKTFKFTKVRQKCLKLCSGQKMTSTTYSPPAPSQYQLPPTQDVRGACKILCQHKHFNLQQPHCPDLLGQPSFLLYGLHWGNSFPTRAGRSSGPGPGGAVPYLGSLVGRRWGLAVRGLAGHRSAPFPSAGACSAGPPQPWTPLRAGRVQIGNLVWRPQGWLRK